jgi:hypothetical protein
MIAMATTEGQMMLRFVYILYRYPDFDMNKDENDKLCEIFLKRITPKSEESILIKDNWEFNSTLKWTGDFWYQSNNIYDRIMTTATIEGQMMQRFSILCRYPDFDVNDQGNDEELCEMFLKCIVKQCLLD